ncbi:hypothetical protein ACF0H5_017345 [Mactra antiquata]
MNTCIRVLLRAVYRYSDKIHMSLDNLDQRTETLLTSISTLWLRDLVNVYDDLCYFSQGQSEQAINGSSGPVVGCALRDRKVPGSNPTWGTANFLEQEIYLRLLHFTQV